MKMFFTYLCPVIVATTSFGFAYSGCKPTEDARCSDGTSGANERTDSDVFQLKLTPSNVATNGNDSPALSFARDVELSQRQFYDESQIPEKRIVGGKGATIEEFPFMASLERNGKHLCSMCVVTPSWLITAALCFYDTKVQSIVTDAKHYSLVAGTSLLTNRETRACVRHQVIRDVGHIKLHPDFSLEHPIPDLALVKASRSLPLSDRIQPAHLPEPHMASEQYLHTNRRCYVAGWGETSLEQTTSRASVSLITGLCMVGSTVYTLPLLQKVTMPLLSLKDCAKKYPWASWLVEDEHICSLSQEGRDACRGDTGGPLVCDGFVVALVSSGVGCANASNPTVYSRVDKHLRWIERTSDLWRMNLAPRRPNISFCTVLGQLVMALASIWQV